MERFHPLRRLGGGERAELILAMERGPFGFERPVVLKRPYIEGRAEADVLAAFAREAIAYGRVEHPAVVKLLSFVEHEGSVCLVLEYVDGVSLATLLDHARARHDVLGDDAALFIASRMFAALAAAHSARDPVTGEFAPVLHRDVNPSNVLLPWNGFAKLADFAFAKVTGASSETTRVGLLKGTYGYMAPEQVIGEAPSTRTDVYAACVVTRELLTGRVTFPRESLPELELLSAMADPVLAPLETLRPDLPDALCDAINRGLSADPDARSVSASRLLAIVRAHGDMDRGRERLRELLGPLRSGSISDRVRAAARVSSEFSTIPPARTKATPSGIPTAARAFAPLPIFEATPDETLRLPAQADNTHLPEPPPAPRAAPSTSSVPTRPPIAPRIAPPSAPPSLQVPKAQRDSLDVSVLASPPRARTSLGWFATLAAVGVMLLLGSMTAVRFVLDRSRAEDDRRAAATQPAAPLTETPPDTDAGAARPVAP